MVNPTFGAANLQWVGVAKEAVYGTPIATPTTYIPVYSPQWTSPTENLTDTGLRGSMGAEFQQIKGLKYEQLTFKTGFYLDSIYFLLRSMMGLPDVVSGSSDPWTHKTSLQNGNNGQPEGTTLFYYDAQGKVWQIPGAQMSDLKLTLKTGGLAEAEVTYIGLPATAITPPTNTPTTQKPMPSWNTIISLGGAAATDYSEIDLEIKRDTKMIDSITGTQAPFAIFAGPMSVSGSLTSIYQGSTDNDLVNNLTNAQQALVVTTNPVGDAIHSIAIQCSVVAFDDAQVDGGSEWMQIKGTIKALTNATDVAGGGNMSPALVTLKNGAAALI